MRTVGSIRLKTKLLLLIGATIVVVSLIFGALSYHRQREALLSGIDEKLFAAAHMAALVPPAGYFDRLENRESVSSEDYDRLVTRNNELCRELGLQYLWSCMQLGEEIVFTTSTSPSLDASRQDHAKFFEAHGDPRAFDTVFGTMQPDYSSFHNEWGHGRMVLVPATDSQGRKYCFGASMSIEQVRTILRQALVSTGLLTLLTLLVGLLVAWLTANRLTRPLVRLTEVSAAIARGELGAAGDEPRALIGGAKTHEIVTLSRSVVAMGQAIRERIKALKESESHQRIVLDSIGDAVIVTDGQGRVVRMNPAAERLTGWSLTEAEGADFSSVAELESTDPATELPAEMEEMLSHCRAFHSPSDLLLVARDGTEHRVALASSPVRSDDRVLGSVVVLRDVTERYHVEEQLRQSQKMEAIGQLAGGIAHDFNNMLAGITGSAEMLQHHVGGHPKADKYIRILSSSADRAADLVGKLLAFARKGKVESTPIDVHEVIQASTSLLERSISKGVTIRLELDANPCVVVGDPSQLQSALLNLGLNARDAMPDGGDLTFSTGNVLLETDDCRTLGLEIPAGRYLHLTVRDTGCGMDAATQQRIFEPFFTTKAEGRGTGLGLPAVYGAVMDHRGAIRVETAPGRGTAFHIYLPLAERVPTVKTEPTPPPELGSGCILIVDDEEVIRALGRGILEHLGYRVLLAADGQEGVELYREHVGEVDLVLLDVVMPRMDGRSCLDALRQIDPAVKVLVTSGFTREQTALEFERAGALGFVKKPFNRVGLSRAIAKAVRTGAKR